VPDAVTGKLMDRLYHHLRNGEGRLAALRMAQEEIRRDHPEPYFWAGFNEDHALNGIICQGDTSPLL
jgi:CHAT domain-containing protein